MCCYVENPDLTIVVLSEFIHILCSGVCSAAVSIAHTTECVWGPILLAMYGALYH